MKEVKIGGTVLGDGSVKICVPVCPRDKLELASELEFAVGSGCDIVEWRGDYWAEKRKKPFGAIKKRLGEKPLLFAYRTSKEGGLGTDDDREYYAENKNAIKSKRVDAVDLEFSKPAWVIDGLMALAKRNNVKVMLSRHLTEGFITKDEMTASLILMQNKGCHLTKLALYARDEDHAREIIGAASEMHEKYAKAPFITVGMGEAGKITRYAKPFYGSSMTYAKGLNETAPGQLPVSEL